MARRAGHEEVDDALGPGGVMRQLRRERIHALAGRVAGLPEQLPQRDGAQPDAALLEEPAARHKLAVEAPVERRLAVHGSATGFILNAAMTLF